MQKKPFHNSTTKSLKKFTKQKKNHYNEPEILTCHSRVVDSSGSPDWSDGFLQVSKMYK